MALAIVFTWRFLVAFTMCPRVKSTTGLAAVTTSLLVSVGRSVQSTISLSSGRDASRAFITGDFTKDGLSDDVSGLTHQDYLGLLEWMHFYERDYKHIGKKWQLSRRIEQGALITGYLSGTYYNKHAEPTEQLQRVADWMHAAQEWKSKQASVTVSF